MEKCHWHRGWVSGQIGYLTRQFKKEVSSMPGPRGCVVLVALLLGAKLACGQVQVDVKRKAETGEATRADGQTSPPVALQQDDAKASWGLLAPGTDPENHLFVPFAKHLAQDQEQFWSYPFHARRSDVKYVVPFLALTGAAIASDSWMSKQVPDSPSQLKRSLDFSNYGLYSLVGGLGATYLWGNITHNDHLTETGFLAGEAAINSTAVAYALKALTQRTRPLDGNGSSGFFKGGYSFPSEHAAIAWSTASILAHEYPGTLTKLLAYGLASGITVSRVTSKQHFSSDVIVGSALGWYLGRQVYRAHHDPEAGGAGWGADEPQSEASERHSSGSKGSPSVPLDSWIYPAFERLAALGYVQTEIMGLRPWTRGECARLLQEDVDTSMLAEGADGGEAGRIYESLRAEFLPEQEKLDNGKNLGLRLDSIYTRVTNISGPPVTDGYNFGSTIVNDNGRPFEEGTNAYSGVSGEGTAGPVSFYLQAEYQHAPGAPAEPLAARDAVAAQLGVPPLPGTPIAEVNRPRIIEGYVSYAFKDIQFSFGKQSLDWGPTEMGPMLWSTNAEPVLMFRISEPHPFRMPSFLRWLGPARTDFLLGQLAGQQYIVTQAGVTLGPGAINPQPFIHAQKLSFKPTANLEFGFSRTVVFGGEGHPLTFGSFWTSFTSVSSDYQEPHIDAGDRHSGFDASYRLPGLRKWLTVYTDSFCEDNVLPLEAPVRCSWSPGLYFPQLPHLPKLDFRAEGVNTDVSGFNGNGISYTNSVYPNSYTNDGNIIGSWAGREGHGVELWSTYWLSPESKIQASYRHQGVDHDFLAGGWMDDAALRTDLMLRSDLAFSGVAQFEKWNFPLLAADTKSNLSFSICLTYRPKWGFRR